MPSTSTVSSTDNPNEKFLISAFNGTVVYVLAYLLVNGLHQLATVMMATRLQVRGTWGVSKITYLLADSEWWRTAVLAVYGVGPLVAAVMGFVAFQWYWRRERARRGQFKLLLIWVALHSCNAVLGALVTDTILKTGFWYVPSWLLRLGSLVGVLLAVIAGLAQLAIGYLASVAFLQAHDSRTVMEYPRRRLMVLSTIFVPWVLGSLLLMLAKLPGFALAEGLHLAAMGLLLVPMAAGCLSELYSSTVRTPKRTRIAWGLLGLLGLLLLSWRLLLNVPLPFGR